MGKSDQIRQTIKEQPGLTPKEIQEHLAGQGIDVSRNLCKVVSYRERNGKKASKKSSKRLRFDERKVDLGRVIRLTEDDFRIHNILSKYVASLDDPITLLHSDHAAHKLQSLKEVKHWINQVKTRKSQRRRRLVLDYFIDDLCWKYSPPPNCVFIPEDKRLKFDFGPPKPSPPDDVFHPSDFRRRQFRRTKETNLLFEKARSEIFQRIKSITEQQCCLLDLLNENHDTIEYLLELDAWRRRIALTALTNSFSVHSHLNDILEAAWSSTKIKNLPNTLSTLLRFDPNTAPSDDWKYHPKISLLLFLAGLWICDRIKITTPNDDGESRIAIGSLRN